MFDWDHELRSRGVNPNTSEADVLSRPGQYHTALEVGYKMMEQDDE